MKTVLLCIISASFITATFAQNKVSITDFELLQDTSWSGNLMYLNYGDNQEVKLKTTMQIKLKGNKIIMSTQFTDEPSANSTNSIKLKMKGTYLGNEKIMEKKQEGGVMEVVTMFVGKDNDKPATMHKTYRFSTKEFSVTKTVQFENSDKKFVRNKYSYERI